MITLLVMTDGRRDCVEATRDSWAMLDGPISRRVIHDDSGDEGYRAWLRREFPGWAIIGEGPRLGFGAAMIRARLWLLSDVGSPFVWWQEDDFRLTRRIDLTAMVEVLNRTPNLAQLALRRQPWNDEERAAGGIVEAHPDDFLEVGLDGRKWLRHRRFFTTNPSLIPWPVINRPWPTGPLSEGMFGLSLFDDGYWCGYWGSRASGEWCRHVGTERAGTGY